ncbi:replication restart DNA helicase PriA [Pacificibacter maritimus]|uniref:Replication restart protein PriA n=1 Tax=Pacificibacter maritimus TaxID=762213 RepID=A0A3N4UBD8_9RHOB|nr:primosomal protein N' [Pacificibacter maritimus]RPE67108.1 replication restart DNA helicase PriA [Pacificibacter maritimus]
MTQDDYFPQGALVAVLTTEPLDRPLDYKSPGGGCRLGDFVQVPLGPRKVLGCVWGQGKGGFDLSKARSISNILDVAPMPPAMMEFLGKVGSYTLTPMPAMLRLATRAPGLLDPPSMRKIYRLGTGEMPRETDARKRVIAALKETPNLAFTLKELAEHVGVGTAVIKGMVPSGAILEQDSPRDLEFPRLDPSRDGKVLSDAQASVATALRAEVAAERYSTTLLKGVTGSGKTEVYLEAVAECLAQGRQALVLLPEIALTSEFLDRVEERFGCKPAEWHSGVTMTERRRVWKMVGSGGAQMVIGARSALFLPYQNLGLIVVDEEHDTSYKQEEGVLYNARDMSVLRASLSGAAVILASATPSLETWANVQAGKYKRLDLESRFGPAVMPEMRALDMRTEKLSATRFISDQLVAAVNERIEKGEQSLLFINRRGYAPVTICRACGFQIACDDCDARMVEHRFLNRLMCHQCGETKEMPTICPSCQVEGRLAPVGPGVERLAEEVAEKFPDAKVAVLSSDLFGSARALKEQIQLIANGDTDIVIGTQLVAKGHNFPNLTLVGVIDADLGLQGSDLRAAERTFQLMRQVAGRAGRAEKRGTALLQTYQPEHPVIRAILAGDEEGFWQAEADERRLAGVPPFGRMAGIILSGPDLGDVTRAADLMARNTQALQRVGAMAFGPAPAPIARVRGKHRVRLLVKADKAVPLQAALSQWAAGLRLPKHVKLQIDIDPQSFW